MGEMGTYTTLEIGGDTVGGILDMGDRGVPEQVPAHWQVYFAVEDTDAAIEQAKGAGGSVMVEPMEVPAGRFAILTDPHGASFAVIALSAVASQDEPRSAAASSGCRPRPRPPIRPARRGWRS